MAVKTKPSPPAPCVAVAGLADTPVGPELSAALAQVSLAGLTDFETVLVLQARNRQGNHERGMFLASVAEVTRRAEQAHIAAGRDPADLRFAASEVRAALVLTRPAADSLDGLASDLMERMPTVLEAMQAGTVDQPRARIFSLWTQDLCDRHAHAVVTNLLPVAATLTTAQLIDAIRKAAIELDPHWARRRYERSLTARRVEGVINPDGTATLAGYNLPADEVAAVCDRLDALAVRVKQAGHPGKLNHIRADIFLGRNGKYVGLDDDQLLAHLLATIPTGEAGNGEETGSSGEGDEDEHDEHDEDGDGEHGDSPADTSRPPDGSPADSDPTPAEGASTSVAEGASASAVVGWGSGRGRGLRLLVGLGTMAGQDRRPGELLGVGHLHAELARRVSAAPHARWFYALVSPDGTPLSIGPIRTRPNVAWHDESAPSYRNVEVWLQLTPQELTRLTHDPPPGWQQIITDIQHHIANNPTGPPECDPTSRLPNAALRRWLNIRDRRCVFPGCRVAPHRCDADHTIEHGRGGPTADVNLAPACRGDHGLRHDGGWRVAQPTPGHFVWTSPLGHRYERTPPPGPHQKLNPMSVRTRPDEDNYGFWLGDNDTCKHVIPPPPEPETQPEPQTEAQPAPSPPGSPEDEVPPF